MNFVKKGNKLLVCFEAREIVLLLLSKNSDKIIEIAEISLINSNQAEKFVFQMAKNSANSKDYELWTGIFSLLDEFNGDCRFCFYLKDKFDPRRNEVKTFSDLESYKEDPPDIVVQDKRGFFEYELKRYRDKLVENELMPFIERKIIKHYSSQYNFLIILQPKPGTSLSGSVFEKLHAQLVGLNLERNPGKIFLHYNSRNNESVFVEIFPQLTITKRPFETGSNQIKRLFMGLGGS